MSDAIKTDAVATDGCAAVHGSLVDVPMPTEYARRRQGKHRLQSPEFFLDLCRRHGVTGPSKNILEWHRRGFAPLDAITAHKRANYRPESAESSGRA